MNYFTIGYRGAERIDDRWDAEIYENNRLHIKAIGLRAVERMKTLEEEKKEESRLFWERMQDENDTEYMKMNPRS